MGVQLEASSEAEVSLASICNEFNALLCELASWAVDSETETCQDHLAAERSQIHS